jgi:hypothetical protein
MKLPFPAEISDQFSVPGLRAVSSRYTGLPKAEDGLPNYFKAVLAIARREQSALASESIDGAIYQQRLTRLIDDMFSHVFSFGWLSSKNDHFAGSAPNLRFVRQFLADLFLPGGPFHGGVASKIRFLPNEILWAPLAHLILSNPEDTLNLNEAIWFRMATCYLGCTEDMGTVGQQRFERDLNLLCNRIGFVEHRPWVHEIIQSIPDRMHGYGEFREMLECGEMTGLLRWSIDLDAFLRSAEEDMSKCRLEFSGYGRLVSGVLGLVEHLERQGSIDASAAQHRRGRLLQAGLEAWRTADNQQDDNWLPFLNRVFGFVNADMTPAQWLAYKHFAHTPLECFTALKALRAAKPELVVEAIYGAGTAVQQVALIREIGVQHVIPENEWLSLLGSAFSTDLGL